MRGGILENDAKQFIDDAGVRQLKETQQSSDRINAASSKEAGTAENEPTYDKSGGSSCCAAEACQNNSTVLNTSREISEIVDTIQATISESYTGMLPRPKDFIQYPEDTRERMCLWQDAFTIDESRRQDKLVKAEVLQSLLSLIITSLLFFTAFILSFVAFLNTHSPWSFGFLALPAVSMLVNLFAPISSQSSRTVLRKQNTDTAFNSDSRS